MESFDEMLNNLYMNLECKKNNFTMVLPEPILIKSGYKTIWKNIKEFLRMFNRHPDDFSNFVNTKTISKVLWISDSKSDGCIFQDKTKKEYVYELMKRYIKEQIVCKSCDSVNTTITKNKDLRKYNFICGDCKNEYII
jgi:translation initiation factor 2 beta subunit (eIF-2beta)/eIF-5